jgi:nucleoside-diphosphate-sugar epimerase
VCGNERKVGVILVTGGAGVLGSRLVKRLVHSGKSVRVLTLPEDPNVFRLADADCEIVYGDISDESTLKGVFDGVETVFHLAAVIIVYDDDDYLRINVEGVRNMVAGAADAGAKHFIYVSSAAVADPGSSAYAKSKMSGEEIVIAQEKMHYTIVRPTLIYDHGGGQEFLMFLEYLIKYPVVPFVGRGQGKKNPVYAADLVQGLLAIADNPKAYGKRYNLSGGEVMTIWDFAKLLLKHQGLSKPFLPIPVSVCRLIARVLEKTMSRPPLTRYAISRIEANADLDHTPAKEDLGYRPIGVHEGLQKCYPIVGNNPPQQDDA